MISHIAAMARNRVIGKNNRLPWHMPDDLAYFFRITRGHHVIMGRRNFEANGKALPNRVNIVVTQQKDYYAPGCVIVNSVADALNYSEDHGETEAFIIGGGEIYKATLPIVQRIYLTIIDTEVEGDTFYPELDMRMWKTLSEKHHEANVQNPHPYTFFIYEKIIK
ncbi:MAG: dihydrofolate reductase [Chlorobi bacterium]|nr:dihydrofolate reductase [Chlorobiota bacterium]